MTTDKPLNLSSRNDHSRCLLCGSLNPRSLRLVFRSGEDGVVRADFRVDTELQGYDGIMHGGVVAALLDAAMTHCLFHRGIQALTGDLHVRFVHSVFCDAQLEIRAWMEANRKSLYRLKAEIVCDGTVMAWAEATFMRRSVSSRPDRDPS